jgi:hypothetical protein
METETRSTGFAYRLYRNLVRLFPHRFRCAFEREMLQTTDEAAVWMGRQSPLGLMLLFTDLAAQLAMAYLRECIWDLRYEVRLLIRKPVFTFVAIASMSLAICAGSSFFSELNGTILRDVPGVAEASELITLQQPISFPHLGFFATIKTCSLPPRPTSLLSHSESASTDIPSESGVTSSRLVTSPFWESRPRSDAYWVYGTKPGKEPRRSSSVIAFGSAILALIRMLSAEQYT